MCIFPMSDRYNKLKDEGHQLFVLVHYSSTVDFVS